MRQDKNIITFDYALKTVLRDKANFVILEGFLSELLKKDIKVIELLESESNTDDKKGRINRVDLKTRITGSHRRTNAKGEIAIIEVQFGDQEDFFQRIMFGISKAVTEQIGKGKKYEDIKKVYSVDVVYFELGRGRDYVYRGKTDFEGLHIKEKLKLSQDERETFNESLAGDLFPEIYLIYPNRFDENIKSRFDEWVYILKCSEVRSGFRAKGTRDAAEKLDVLKMSPAERKKYERDLDRKMNYESAMDTRFKLGKREGRKEGELIGEARGKAEGVKERSLEIARIMLENGEPLKKIMDYTKLTKAEIEGIKGT